MVEGHSVHRIAASHTRRLAGKVFKASSPNGRFADGASQIHQRKFSRIEVGPTRCHSLPPTHPRARVIRHSTHARTHLSSPGLHAQAIGKNLFAFFAAAGTPDVVVHVHFGMAGVWSVESTARASPPTDTTRLRLEVNVCAHVFVCGKPLVFAWRWVAQWGMRGERRCPYTRARAHTHAHRATDWSHICQP